MNTGLVIFAGLLGLVLLLGLWAWDTPHCARCRRRIGGRIAGGEPHRPLCHECLPHGDPYPTGPSTWRSWLF